MQLPARGVAAFEAAIRFASAPTTRCRSAYLVEVCSNHRLLGDSSMRRAQQCRYFASSLPPNYRHSRLTIVRRGCKRSRLAGIHGEAMYTALTLRSACSYSSYRLPMSGVEGLSPRVLLGDLKGAILSRERMAPFPASPARRRENLPPARHKISAHEHNKENYVAEGGYGAFFGKLRGKHPRAG